MTVEFWGGILISIAIMGHLRQSAFEGWEGSYGGTLSAGLRAVLAAALAIGLVPSVALAEGDDDVAIGSSVVVGEIPGAASEQVAEEAFLYELDASGNATIMGLAEGVKVVDLVIPSEIDGHPVNCIGESAFEDNDLIESVVIPDGVELVGNSAFEGCGMLSSVSFPKTPFSLGDSAFQGCSSLKGITIPASLKSVGAGGFGAFNKSGLQEVNFENGISKIPDYCMWGVSELSSVVIPDSVTEIGAWSFFGCGNLSEVTFPQKIASIGNCAFSHCTSLRAVTFPGSLRSIGGQAFSGSGLTDIRIEGGLSDIGYLAFSDCSSLRSASIDTDVLCRVGSSAFADCSMLTDLYLSPYVSSVDGFALSNTPLRKITGYPGSYAQTFAEENGFAFETPDDPLSFERASIEQNDGILVYQGKPVVPTWLVSYGTLSLQEGEDYSVSYEDNESAGMATARFAGTGLFRGEVTRCSVPTRCLHPGGDK